MNFVAPSFHMLRSCRASLSTRALTRPSLGRYSGRLSRVGIRCYSEKSSEEGPSSPQDEAGNEGSKDDAPAQDDLCAEVKNSLKAKEAEVLDLTSRLRYLQADFLNLQRNSAREREQTKDYAISRFASDLLETVDVLSIALKSVPQNSLKLLPNYVASTLESSQSQPSVLPKSHAIHLQELYVGVEMTHRLLLQTLFKYQIKPFDPTGDKFDPNLHEALYQAPIPGKEPGTVIDCQKTGYMIKDRVLRAAQVGVAQEVQ